MAAPWKRLSPAVSLLILLVLHPTPSYAAEDILFGPRDLTISWLRLHLSIHTFSADGPGEGTLTLYKETPETRIEGGFVLLNNQLLGLHEFLQGENHSTEREVSLRFTNYLIVFMRGAPGATLSIAVRKAAAVPPPQVTFQAQPQTIILGETSTLEWTTAHADRVAIEPHVGEVSLSGAHAVSPDRTTTYTLTAAGEGGITTKSVTIEVRVPPPSVTLSADPEIVTAGESSMLSWNSVHGESAVLEPGIGFVALVYGEEFAANGVPLEANTLFAWSAKSHREMSAQAIGISQLPQLMENSLGLSFSSKRFLGPAHSETWGRPMEFGPDMNQTAVAWIMDGSAWEDEFLRASALVRYLANHDMRSVNHYYNPFWDNRDLYPYTDDGWGKSWESQEGGLNDALATGIGGWDLWVGKPSMRWGYDGCLGSPPVSDFTRSPDNFFSWVYARKYFYAALSGDSTELDGIGGIEGKANMNENERDRCFALLFRSLGQLMHLIQDAGNPEHTRNDAHPLSGYPLGFESYAGRQDLSSALWSSPVIPWRLIVK